MKILKVKTNPLPAECLITKYAEKPGYYTDSYVLDVPGYVELKTFIYAFYTSWLFKCERFILKWLVRKPSKDDDITDLMNGETEKFAAWDLEAKTEDELLMCDFVGKTRSWFKVEFSPSENQTRLMFGTVVVPDGASAQGNPKLGMIFSAMLWFHVLYARALLVCAVSNLEPQELDHA